MWVDGNIHATEFTGAMAALHLVDLLLAEDRPDGASDQLLNQVTFYVVPRLNPDGAARAMAASPEARAAFAREARTLAKVSHPNVVSVYDIRREGDHTALVMEYLRGTRLD